MAVQEVDNSADAVNGFLNLFETGELSDIEIKVGNKRFQTHRVVLCMASDVLKTMLMSNFWPEGRTNKVILREDPECETVFEIFLRYLYTGKIVLSKVNVMPLLILADKYNVSTLSESCLNYMRTNCCLETVENMIPWLQYAIMCGYREIEDTCFQCISNNFSLIFDTDEFLSLNKETLEKFLRNSELVVNSEIVLYWHLYKWVLKNASEDSMEEMFLSLARHVRFPMIPFEKLVLLEKDELMNRNKDFFLQTIFLCMRFHHGLPIPMPKNRFHAFEMETQFLPRIYQLSDDTCCTYNIHVSNVSKMEEGAEHGAFFSTPVSFTERDRHIHQDWNVGFYPRGVKYEPCLMIGVPNNRLNGMMFRTVRLAFSTNCEKRTKFKISVLITVLGKQCFTYKSVTKDAIFDRDCTRFNFDDVIPFDEVCKKDSPYKSGGDSINLDIYIRPVHQLY